MILKHDKLLSNFAFNSNLRHYNVEACPGPAHTVRVGAWQGLTLGAPFQLNLSVSECIRGMI